MGLAPQAASAPATPRQAPANPNANMTTSAAGIAALRASEGQRNGGGAYNDTANNCTQGTGILVHTGPCTGAELARPPDQQANEATFQTRLHDAEASVRRQVPGRALTQDQFDALVSATFNLGGHARPVLERANRHDDPGVVGALRDRVFVQPRDAHGAATGPLRRSQGLANRRKREVQPFLPHGPGR
jgi:GH24 family phage-related lysozyme (muramidase)